MKKFITPAKLDQTERHALDKFCKRNGMCKQTAVNRFVINSLVKSGLLKNQYEWIDEA